MISGGIGAGSPMSTVPRTSQAKISDKSGAHSSESKNRPSSVGPVDRPHITHIHPQQIESLSKKLEKPIFYVSNSGLSCTDPSRMRELKGGLSSLEDSVLDAVLEAQKIERQNLIDAMAASISKKNVIHNATVLRLRQIEEGPQTVAELRTFLKKSQSGHTLNSLEVACLKAAGKLPLEIYVRNGGKWKPAYDICRLDTAWNWVRTPRSVEIDPIEKTRTLYGVRLVVDPETKKIVVQANKKFESQIKGDTEFHKAVEELQKCLDEVNENDDLKERLVKKWGIEEGKTEEIWNVGDYLKATGLIILGVVVGAALALGGALVTGVLGRWGASGAETKTEPEASVVPSRGMGMDTIVNIGLTAGAFAAHPLLGGLAAYTLFGPGVEATPLGPDEGVTVIPTWLYPEWQGGTFTETMDDAFSKVHPSTTLEAVLIEKLETLREFGYRNDASLVDQFKGYVETASQAGDVRPAELAVKAVVNCVIQELEARKDGDGNNPNLYLIDRWNDPENGLDFMQRGILLSSPSTTLTPTPTTSSSPVSPTPSRSSSATRTVTITPTGSPSSTATATMMASLSALASVSGAPTTSPTPSEIASITASISAWVSATPSVSALISSSPSPEVSFVGASVVSSKGGIPQEAAITATVVAGIGLIAITVKGVMYLCKARAAHVAVQPPPAPQAAAVRRAVAPDVDPEVGDAKAHRDDMEVEDAVTPTVQDSRRTVEQIVVESASGSDADTKE